MPSPQNNHALQQAQSFVDWWKLAGVDYLAGNETVDWLTTEQSQTVNKQAQGIAAKASRPLALEATQPASTPVLDWPENLEELNRAIVSNKALPGTAFGRQLAKPVGAKGAPFMIISDFPEMSELSAGRMGSQPLLSAMLLAAGIDLDRCYFASLAYSRPTAGALPDSDKTVLSEFILHQIGLVRPQILLLLGTSATEMLLGKDLMAARGNLENINHDVHNMAALATFHPRTLAARPILKSQAWRDLQVVMQRDSA